MTHNLDQKNSKSTNKDSHVHINLYYHDGNMLNQICRDFG